MSRSKNKELRATSILICHALCLIPLWIASGTDMSWYEIGVVFVFDVGYAFYELKHEYD